MEEKVWLGYDITQLSVCKKYLEDAKRVLVDVNDTDKIYEEIHYLIEKVIELKSDKENKYESMVI